MTRTETTDHRATWTWRRLLTGVLLVNVALEIYDLFNIEVPFGAMIAIALLLATSWWLRRAPESRAPVVAAGILCFLQLLLILTVFGGIDALGHPESWIDFLGFAAYTVVNAVGVAAAAMSLSRRSVGKVSPAPVVVGAAGVAVYAILALVALAAGLSVGDDAAQPGDIRLVASNFKFSETEVRANSGEVGVWIDNRDTAHHDFTIKEVGTLQLPGRHAKRHTLRLEAGRYAFVCTLHPDDMRGTLVVSGF